MGSEPVGSGVGSLGYDLDKALGAGAGANGDDTGEAYGGGFENPGGGEEDFGKELARLEKEVRELDDWTGSFNPNEFVMQPQVGGDLCCLCLCIWGYPMKVDLPGGDGCTWIEQLVSKLRDYHVCTHLNVCVCALAC